MPIKVRCSGCEKVLNAPDAARGKAIKCPSCATKIRVPAKKRKPAAAKAVATDEEDILGNLNLDQIEDKSVRVCPKCGSILDAEDTVCGGCHFDLEAGTPAEAARRKRENRGPNPAEFYRSVWKDAWEFLKKNKHLAIRTGIYSVLFTLLYLGCLYMVLWCNRLPPKTFWMFFSFVASMITPGWVWHLTVEIIQGTMARKKVLKRVNFDIFLCAALGIKTLVWSIVYTLPIQLVTGLPGAYFISTGNVVLGAVLIGMGYLIVWATFPIVMVHMSMPVTYRAWMSPFILQVFSRNAGPSMYSALVQGVVLLPLLIGAGVAGGLFGNDVAQFVDTMRLNSAIEEAQAIDVTVGEEIDERTQQLRDAETQPLDWSLLGLPAGIWFASYLTLGFAVVFGARANGQFALFFRRNLELIAEEKQATWQPKAGKDGKKSALNRPTRITLSVLGIVAGGAILGFGGPQVQSLEFDTAYNSGRSVGLITGLIFGIAFAGSGIYHLVLDLKQGKNPEGGKQPAESDD